MESHRSLLLVLYTYSIILMFYNFLGRMFASIVALLHMVFPSLIVQRVQAIISTFSQSTAISVRRKSIQPIELKWIWAICVSLLGQKPATPQDVRFKLFPLTPTWLFSPLTNVSPLWYSLAILKATWLLATISYASARGVGRASAGIVGHVSRQLIMHIWSLGLIQVQTLRLDVLNRLGAANFALHNRVTSHPFFGLRIGQITFFDLCVPQYLKVWALALIYRLLDPDRRGFPCNDSPTERQERDAGHQAFFLEEPLDFADTLQLQKLDRQKSLKEGLLIAVILSLSCGGSTTHSRRKTRSVPYPSVSETPIPRFVVCTANNRYSTAKQCEACGENEQLFCDRSSDSARRLLAAILDIFTSFGCLDTDFHEAMKNVQLYQLKASNKDEQGMFPISVIVPLRIQDTPPSIPLLKYPQFASASTVACFSVMNSLGIVHFDIRFGSPGNANNHGLVTFSRDSVQRTHHQEFVTKSRINGAYVSLPCTTKDRFGTERSNAPKGEAYSYVYDNPETPCIFQMQITGALCGRPIHVSGSSGMWC